MKKVFYVLTATLLLTSCFTKDPNIEQAPKLGSLIPRENGDYEIVAKSSLSSQEAVDIALYTAKTECEKYQKRYFVKENKVGYKGGTFDEKTDRLIDDSVGIAKNAALFLGGADDFAKTFFFPDNPTQKEAYYEAYLIANCM